MPSRLSVYLRRLMARWAWPTLQLAIVAVGAGLILTSGPRSLQGHTAEAATDPEPASALAEPGADPIEVDWRTLAGLDLRTGELSAELQSVVGTGTEVKVPGFMVPLEDDLDRVSEFLLVPYVGACVHTPPPPPNQLVFVRMEEGRSVPVEWWDPVWVHGVLTLDETENVYSTVSYTLTAVRTSTYEW